MAMSVADVDGVKIAGLLIDAGTDQLAAADGDRPVRLVGQPRRQPDVAARRLLPHRRSAVGKATETLRINSNNVILDHTWLWRGDHRDGVGWNVNTAATGLVVNGNDVTAYGLFVEHYQKYQTIWNGNGGGRTSTRTRCRTTRRTRPPG